MAASKHNSFDVCHGNDTISWYDSSQLLYIQLICMTVTRCAGSADSGLATVQNKGTETEQTVSVFFCVLILFVSVFVAHNANAGLHRKRQKAHRVSDPDTFRPVLVQVDACLPETRTDLKSQRRLH